MASAARVQGIDVARGLASAIMIQGHAYDGWVRAEEKTSASYLFTRVLGTLPLPSFLLLAGAAIALRLEAADARGEAPASVRAALVRRGLTVFAIGYAVNALSALVDGFDGPETFFRADVLQVIGLSIVAIAGLGVGARRGGSGARLDRTRLAIAAAVIAVVPVLVCPPVSTALRGVAAPASYVVGLFAYVPSVTRMPFVPLASWAGIGLALSLALIRANRVARSTAGAPAGVLAGLFVGALVVAIVFTALEAPVTEAFGGPLDQRSWGVVPNAIELAARGTVVLATGALLTPRLPERVRGVLARLGRGSLVAYVFHVPFCYGALGRPIAGRLSMVEATFVVVALEIASYGAVVVRDLVVARMAARSGA